MFAQARRGGRRTLGAYPTSGCIGFINVAGTYRRQADGSYTLQADTPTASSAGVNTGYGEGEMFYLPDGFGSFNPPGTSGRIILNGTLWEGNQIRNVQGWGLNAIQPAPPNVTPGTSCPAGTAGAAPAPAPAPSGGGGTTAPAPTTTTTTAAPAPTTTTAAPAPTTTTTAAPAPTTTTAAPEPSGVPTYSPADVEERRQELEGEYATTGAPTGTEGPSLPLPVVLAGAALFVVLFSRERRR